MQTKLTLSVPLLATIVLLAGLQQAVALPTITSTMPSDGATGVSPGASVVFTFNTAMDPTQTYVEFTDATASDYPTMIFVWSVGNTVLTCTPSPNFANNHNIQWEVQGFDPQEDYLDTSGGFTTVAGVNGGSGTNAVTTFTVTKSASYNQTNAAAPAFSTYDFDASTTLASNRMATSITLTLPTSPVTSLNLDEDDLQPEMFDTDTPSTTNLTTFNTTYPSGNYSFTVKNGGSSQSQTVKLPANTLPNAPQVSNYNAAQTINPSLPFTLTWNTFNGGGSADWIFLLIYADDGSEVLQTPEFGQTGALAGTAMSFTIPAGTLQVGSNYASELVFYHITQTTSGANVTYAAYLSGTMFSIATTASAVPPPPLLTITPSGTNVVLKWPTNATGFNLEFATNLISPVWKASLPAPVVVNTNNAVTNGISGPQKFYRLSQ